MKMVKSLLLGTAAGLVAMTGAQAADLPVKAKAAEYVKICSLYGAGFYYIPGTDICLKVGGHVRFQMYSNNPQDSSKGGMTGAWGTRVSDVDTGIQSRAWITHDTRQQSAYGVVRTYMLYGFNSNNLGTSAASAGAGGGGSFLYLNRGFIQFAGFTFGRAQSFFDIYPNASFSVQAGANYVADTGDGGVNLAGYTATLGNGVSATVAIEQSRRNATIDGNNTSGVTFDVSGVKPGNVNEGISGFASGTTKPDFVGNLRVDQAWGSILVGGAMHDASSSYYGGISHLAGHASDKWGYAGTAGFIWNLPMIAAGDRLSAQFAYTAGATKYAENTPGSLLKRSGSTIGFGIQSDGVVTAGASGSIELTTAWSITGAFEHLWTPALRTSFYGSYLSTTYTDAGKLAICNAFSGTSGIGTAAAAAGCDPNWSAYNIGSRTQWQPVKDLAINFDLMYMKLNSMKTATGLAAVGAISTAGIGAGTYTVSDQSAWVGTIRVERSFVP